MNSHAGARATDGDSLRPEDSAENSLPPARPTPPTLAEHLPSHPRPASSVVRTAASGKAAFEGYKNHGVFTWALLDALRHGDTNANGTIEHLTMQAAVGSPWVRAKSPRIAFCRLLEVAMRILRLIAAASLISASTLVADGARAQGSEAMSEPGGHLVLLLDAAEVRASWLSSMRDEIRRRLREAKVGFGGLAVADNVVRVRLAKPEEADAALKALTDLAPAAPGGILERVLGLMRGSATSDVAVAKVEGGNIIITPTEVGLERRTNAALDNAVMIAGRRLDGMGVAATAVRQGRDRNLRARAGSAGALKDLLTKPARLGSTR